jgi:DNA-binding NarL/FixJ family response regulator
MKQQSLLFVVIEEREVLGLVAEGLGDKQVARRLSISHYTVSRHMSSVLEKMSAASRTEAAVRAVRERLVE